MEMIQRVWDQNLGHIILQLDRYKEKLANKLEKSQRYLRKNNSMVFKQCIL